VDGGRSWKAAVLHPSQRTQFGWRQWEFHWTPPEVAYYTILARARDAAGNTQPFDQEWNPSGYSWNVVPRVGLDVVKEPAIKPQPEPPAASTGNQPAGFRAACGGCHDEDMLRQQRLTHAQWDREITKMTGWGAKVGDQDRGAFLDYLFANFGPRQRR
jgi:hypothetical protein